MEISQFFSQSQAKKSAAKSKDPRIGHLMQENFSVKNTRLAILGFPTDEGVQTNSGRIGAKKAPDAIREIFWKLTSEPGNDNFLKTLHATCDLGNLKISDNLETSQNQWGKAVSSLLSNNIMPIIFGGGHETAFGHFLGYAEVGREVSILNWDAHADVRELVNGQPHSGSPFRQAILHSSKKCRQYIVAELLPYSVSNEHLQFIEESRGIYYWANSLTTEKIDQIYASLKAPAMVTFDFDIVEHALAPGVSAPATGGISPLLLFHTAWMAGKTSTITSIDFAEINPDLDRDNQTSRLALSSSLSHFSREWYDNYL